MIIIIIVILLLCIFEPLVGISFILIGSTCYLVMSKPSSFTPTDSVSPTENIQPEVGKLNLDEEPDFVTYQEIIDRGLSEYKWNKNLENDPEWQAETAKLRAQVAKNQKKADDEMTIEALEREIKKLKEQKYKSVCDMA